MSRIVGIAAAQLGPISRGTPRSAVVDRMIALLRQAHARDVRLVVFPEMALTPFFPRQLVEDPAELASYFEAGMPGPATQPLFDAARKLGIAFYLGYCERAGDSHYNSSVLVQDGRVVGHYRKVHVPGTAAVVPGLPVQHLEKLYFRDGDQGFGAWNLIWDGADPVRARVGMAICNDRRWPETYRVMALQGAELVVLGYNSPAQLADYPAQNELRAFHHLVCMQAAAYQNGIWIVAAAKAGREDGCDMLGQSCVVSPSGQVQALAQGVDDELVACHADLDLAQYYKDFHGLTTNRRPAHYRAIAEHQPRTEGPMMEALP